MQLKIRTGVVILALAALSPAPFGDSLLQHSHADESNPGKHGKPLIQDNFDRDTLGDPWTVNDARALRTSKVSPTKFASQAQIRENRLEIRRTQGSDHAASVKTNVRFKNAIFQLKFRLNGKNKFSLNLNDPNLKTVHAGHICKVEVGPSRLVIQDQKTGTMDLENRKVRLEGSEEQKKTLAARLKTAQKSFPCTVPTDTWHRLKVILNGSEILVHINDEHIGAFRSPGIGHSTKENMAFSVPGSLDVDDLQIWSIATP